MGINYTQLMGALLGIGGVAALGGKIRANKLNNYEDSLNASLPDGYKIPTQHHNFYFGDVDTQSKAYDELYKNAMQNYKDETDNNEYGTLTGHSFKSPRVAKEYFSSVYAPDQADTLKRSKDYQETENIRYVKDLLTDARLRRQEQQPITGQMQLPLVSLNGKTTNPNPLDLPSPMDGSGPLVAGATKTPPLNIKPNDYLSLVGHDISQQNADTSKDRLGFEKDKWNEQAPNRGMQLQKLASDVKLGNIKSQYLAQYLRSEIMKNNRAGTSGKPSSMQQFDAYLQDGVRHGLWTQQEANHAKRIKVGIMGKPNSVTTTQYDPVTGQPLRRTQTVRNGGIQNSGAYAGSGGGTYKGQFGEYRF